MKQGSVSPQCTPSLNYLNFFAKAWSFPSQLPGFQMGSTSLFRELGCHLWPLQCKLNKIKLKSRFSSSVALATCQVLRDACVRTFHVINSVENTLSSRESSLGEGVASQRPPHVQRRGSCATAMPTSRKPCTHIHGWHTGCQGDLRVVGGSRGI